MTLDSETIGIVLAVWLMAAPLMIGFFNFGSRRT